ncbi:MAG TPA: lamin tail domain-containing protein [archaeon]|nr:lamin tail domain-containing protein [archaeon]
MLLLSVFPSIVFAQMYTSEIAWMGTEESAANEWIELKNMSSSDIHLDGWTLRAEDGTPDIRLSGTIRGGGYFLLERTDDSTVLSMTADQVYAGALSNSGEQLELKDSSGVLVNSVRAKSGWPAGDNMTKNTMQWSGSQSSGGWITAPPTPRAENALPPIPKAVATPQQVSKKSTDTTKKFSLQENAAGVEKTESINSNNEETQQPAQLIGVNTFWLVGSAVAGLILGFLVLAFQSMRKEVL